MRLIIITMQRPVSSQVAFGHDAYIIATDIVRHQPVRLSCPELPWVGVFATATEMNPEHPGAGRDCPPGRMYKDTDAESPKGTLKVTGTPGCLFTAQRLTHGAYATSQHSLKAFVITGVPRWNLANILLKNTEI